MIGALTLAVVCGAFSQESQFIFDPTGNLQSQSSASLAPPEILAQPRPQIARPGELASFSVVVADPTGILYQWRFNGTNISGATRETLLLANVTSADEGQYSVQLVNNAGKVTSAPAGLFIDSDGDGLPDSWEMAHFGNLNQTANGDFDFDGVSNLQEFLDGTDPRSSADAFYRLTAIGDGGSISILPNLPTYTNGQRVTLTASPSGTFRAWTGDLLSVSNTATLIMNANKTVFARFGNLSLVWTNAAGGDWNNAQNWSPNVVPGSNDSAFILISTVVTLNTNTQCSSLTLGSASSVPALTGTGTLMLLGSSYWSSGTMSGSGQTVIAPGAELTLANASLLTLSHRVLENAGITTWIGAGIGLDGGAVFTNDASGLFDIQTPAAISVLTGVARFDNTGTFRKSQVAGTNFIGNGVAFSNYGTLDIETGVLLFNGAVNNGGTMAVASGLLQFRGAFLNSGLVTVSPGAASALSGGGSNSGSFIVSPEAVVEMNANAFTLNPGSQLNGDGLYRINGFASLVAKTDTQVENLDLSSTIDGTATLTVNHVLNWTGGTMSGSGRTLIAPGASLNVNSSGDVTLSRTLENAGTALCTGTGGFFGGGGSAIITNRPGALFEIRNNGGFNHGLFGCRLDNAGVFRKDSSTGTNFFSGAFAFYNYGTVDLRSGSLALRAGYTSSPGASLNCTFSGAIPDTNFGRLQISGAVTLNGALNVDFTNGYLPNPGDSFTIINAGSLNGAFATFSYPADKVTLAFSNTTSSVVLYVAEVAPEKPVLMVPVLSGTNVLLTWASTSNVNYRVETTSSLGTSIWSPLPGDVLAQSTSATKTAPLSSSNSFYRVRVIP